MSNIHVITCATEYNPQVSYLKKSFDLCDGWCVHIVGLGMKWEGFRTKMKCYSNALQSFDKDTMIVCLDAYDSICIKDSTGFMDDFLSFDSPIVVGFEPLCAYSIYNRFLQLGCCPDITKWKKNHNISTSDKIYVNSGCIVGYAGEIRKMFDWILNYTGFTVKDDQIGVGLYMNEFPQKIKLDTDNKLVFNDNFGGHLKINTQDPSKLHIDLQTTPYFIQFPGIRSIPHTTNYEVLCSFLLDIKAKKHKMLVDRKLVLIILSRICIVVLLLFIVYHLFIMCRRKK